MPADGRSKGWQSSEGFADAFRHAGAAGTVAGRQGRPAAWLAQRSGSAKAQYSFLFKNV